MTTKNDPLQMRVNVNAQGQSRNLLMITEDKKGDVYIRLKSGTQVGIPPNEIKVIQDRYSIHPSSASPEYTTLKHTVELEDGQRRETVALNNAVKFKKGFAPLFVHRCSELESQFYDVKQDDFDEISLGDLDPDKDVLIFSIFVGHRDTLFPSIPENSAVIKFFSKEFQIVICYAWFGFPALPFSWTSTIFTLAPEIFDDEIGRQSAFRKMAGIQAGECVSLFLSIANHLLANLIEQYAMLAPNEEMRDGFRDILKTIPQPAVISF